MQEGQPYGSLLMTSFERDPNGNVVVDPNTGYPIIAAEDQIRGNIQPDYLAGMTNKLTYKSFSFGFTFDVRKGGMMFSRTKSTMTFAGTDPITTYGDREPLSSPEVWSKMRMDHIAQTQHLFRMYLPIGRILSVRREEKI